LSANSTSQLDVSFQVISGPANITQGDQVNLSGDSGTVSIEANQPGNTMYCAATPVTFTFVVK